MKIIRISAIWCSSCLVTFPIWKSIQKKYPSLEFVELDYDQDDISFYQVGDVLPVMIFMKDGKEVTRLVGEVTEKELESVIEREKMVD